VPVLGHGFMGCQLFQPPVVVMVEPGLVVIDKDRGRDMHGIHQQKMINVLYSGLI
jgi:hypothetical protein